jgi:hypothetical protein
VLTSLTVFSLLGAPLRGAGSCMRPEVSCERRGWFPIFGLDFDSLPLDVCGFVAGDGVVSWTARCDERSDGQVILIDINGSVVSWLQKQSFETARQGPVTRVGIFELRG